MGLSEGEGEGKLFSSSNATIVFVYNVPPFFLGLPKGTGWRGPVATVTVTKQAGPRARETHKNMLQTRDGISVSISAV